MSVYLHVTLEVRAAGMARFLEAMDKTAVPFLEREGWRLAGAFIQRTGRLNTVIDLWELEDFQHYDRALKRLVSDDGFAALSAVLADTVISETIVFADRASYMR